MYITDFWRDLNGMKEISKETYIPDFKHVQVQN